jgi:very-short-patch-repair endonuclease
VSWEEEHWLDSSWLTDFYLKEPNLVIEINGHNHFVPYTSKLDSPSNFKQRLLLESGYNLMNLDPNLLEGLTKNGNTHKLDDLLHKTIRSYIKM